MMAISFDPVRDVIVPEVCVLSCRSKVITILKEVVGCTMPLFMFIELYEKR